MNAIAWMLLNVKGAKKKLGKLLDIIKEKKIDIAIFTETNITLDMENTCKTIFSNYNIEIAFNTTENNRTGIMIISKKELILEKLEEKEGRYLDIKIKLNKTYYYLQILYLHPAKDKERVKNIKGS